MSTSRLDFLLSARDNASKGLDSVSRAYGRVFGAVQKGIDQEEKASKATHKLQRSLRGLQKQAKKTGGNFRSLGRGIKLFAAGAGVFAAIRMGQGILTASRNALKFEGQLASLGGSVEDQRRELEELQKQIGHTFSMQSLVSAKAKVKAFNLPLQLTPNLLKSIQVRSAAMGISTDFALHSMIEGLAKGERRILDNLSIVLHATETYDKYAKSIGKTRKQLNKQEQQTAIVLETQRQLEESTGKLPENVKQLYQAEALAADAQRELNDAMAQMQPVVTAAMFGIANFANEMKDSGVIGGLKEVALAIEEVGVAQVWLAWVQNEAAGKTPYERAMAADPKKSLTFWRKQAAILRAEEVGFVKDLTTFEMPTVEQLFKGDIVRPRKDYLTFLAGQDSEVAKGWAEEEKRFIEKKAHDLLAIEMQGRNKAAQFAENDRIKRALAEKKAMMADLKKKRDKNLKENKDAKNAAKFARKALEDKQALEIAVKELQLVKELDKVKRLIIKRDMDSLRLLHQKEKGMNATLVMSKELVVQAKFKVDHAKLLSDIEDDQRRKKEKSDKKSLKDDPEIKRLEDLTRSLQTTANAMSEVSKKGAVVFETMGDLVDIESQVKKGILEKDRVAEASIGILGRGAAEFVEGEREKAAILAIMELAQGFATLARPEIAAGHFAASALFGAVAAGAGGSSSAGASAGGTAEDTAGDTVASGAGGGGQPQQANIVVNFSDGVVLGSRQDIGRGIIEATKSLNKTGISAGAV